MNMHNELKREVTCDWFNMMAAQRLYRLGFRRCVIASSAVKQVTVKYASHSDLFLFDFRKEKDMLSDPAIHGPDRTKGKILFSKNSPFYPPLPLVPNVAVNMTAGSQVTTPAST